MQVPCICIYTKCQIILLRLLVLWYVAGLGEVLVEGDGLVGVWTRYRMCGVIGCFVISVGE